MFRPRSHSLIALVFAATLLSACSDDASETRTVRSPTATAPSISPGPGAAAAWRALNALDQAALSLPEATTPEDTSGSESGLEDWRPSGRRAGKVPLYEHSLPLSIPPKRYKKPPLGFALTQAGVPVDYDANLDRSNRRTGWMVKGDKLLLASTDDPRSEAGAVTLDYAGLQATIDRLFFTRSGLAPADFVDLEVTIEAQTRQTLFLPAPARAEWSVAIPQDAELRFGIAIRPRPVLTESPGDGAEVSVEIDGAPVWSEKISPGQGFEDHVVSLAQHAGETVRLALVSDPRKNPENDFVVWSAPRLIGAPPAPTRRVIVVGIDTLRPDHTGVHGYGRDTTPELDTWAEEAFVFERAWAPAPRTKPSFRSAFTGVYPLKAVNHKTLAQVLYGEGFATGGISANVHLVPRLGFNRGFEYWHYDNGAQGDDQVDRALAWLGTHQQEDSFLFLHLMDPHIFYSAPRPLKNKFVQDKPEAKLPDRFNRWDIYRRLKRGDLGPKAKRFIEARYDGEVAYTSQQLRRFLDAVEAMPGETLTLIHSDHGEEFFEHDGFEHNHTLYDEVTRVLFWVKGPQGWSAGPHRLGEEVSLIDLVPTVYDAIDLPKDHWPDLDGISLRPLMDATQSDRLEQTRADLEQRSLHLGYLMYDTERWAAVDDGKKYILHTVTGDEEFYDLQKDPGETKNRASKMGADLDPWRAELANATGWHVGDGWRIRQRSQVQPYSIQFDQAVRAAQVIDPEAGVKRRANLEWGESPIKWAKDVAGIELSEDRRQLSVTPGPKPSGTIAVRFGDTPPTTATFTAGDATGTLKTDGGVVRLGSRRLTVDRGTVILPRDTMAQQIEVKKEDQAALEALRALGYIE